MGVRVNKVFSKAACPRIAPALCGGGFSKAYSLQKGRRKVLKKDTL